MTKPSLILPDPVKPQMSSLAGSIDNPQEFFGKEKADTFAKLDALMDLQVLLNRIWIAVWVRPDGKTIKRADGTEVKLLLTDKTRDEDVYQGCVGLVIKLGPKAFVDDDNTNFDVRPAVGDWVLFKRQNGGMRFRHNNVDCVMLESEQPIKAVLSRPDVVE